MIPIYKPYLPKKCLKYAYDALESGWISSQGKYKNLCQDLLKEKFGYKNVLLVNNGTSACYLMAKALKFKNPKITYIIVPNNVYVASWNTFLYDNQYKLIVADINPSTWNIDLNKIKTVKPNTAILIVHNLGNICNILNFKKTNNVIILEDNCEGLGGKYSNFYSGTQSFCSSLSFFANKNITCGEGGAFCTNENDVYEYVNLYHGQGVSNKRYIHSMLGTNMRMTNIQAALLYGQLKIYDEIMEKKENVFNFYKKILSNCNSITLQITESDCQHSKWMFGIRIHNNKSYDILNEYFLKNNVETRPMFYPINKHGHLQNIKCNSKISKKLSDEVIILPSYPELTKSDINKITKVLFNYIKENIKNGNY